MKHFIYASGIDLKDIYEIDLDTNVPFDVNILSGDIKMNIDIKAILSFRRSLSMTAQL